MDRLPTRGAPGDHPGAAREQAAVPPTRATTSEITLGVGITNESNYIYHDRNTLSTPSNDDTHESQWQEQR